MKSSQTMLTTDEETELCKDRFYGLADQWKQERRNTSSAVRMASLPAYQQIIQLGNPVIPLILGELTREPDHWFLALMQITGEDPVPQADRGNLQKMALSWVNWGRERGF